MRNKQNDHQLHQGTFRRMIRSQTKTDFWKQAQKLCKEYLAFYLFNQKAKFLKTPAITTGERAPAK